MKAGNPRTAQTRGAHTAKTSWFHATLSPSLWMCQSMSVHIYDCLRVLTPSCVLSHRHVHAYLWEWYCVSVSSLGSADLHTASKLRICRQHSFSGSILLVQPLSCCKGSVCTLSRVRVCNFFYCWVVKPSLTGQKFKKWTTTQRREKVNKTTYKDKTISVCAKHHNNHMALITCSDFTW